MYKANLFLLGKHVKRVKKQSLIPYEVAYVVQWLNVSCPELFLNMSTELRRKDKKKKTH